MGLLETMKQVAQQTNDVNVPAAFMFGTVTSASPLSIRVDNRFDISGDAIVVTKELKAGAYLTHKHTVNPHGHTVPTHSTETADAHTHSVQPFQSENTGLETAQEIYFGLAVGDKVVLFRNQGGQSFLVMGRV